MTRYARALGSKGANSKVPEPATPWVEMGVANINQPDGIEEKNNDAPKEKSVQKPKKKVVKLSPQKAKEPKLVKNTEASVLNSVKVEEPESIMETKESKIINGDEANRVGEESTQNVAESKSSKAGKKRTKANVAEDGGGKKTKGTVNAEGMEPQNSDILDRKGKDESGSTPINSKEKKKKKKSSAISSEEQKPANFVADDTENVAQPEETGNSVEKTKKNGNLGRNVENKKNQFSKTGGKKFSDNQPFEKPQPRYHNSEKDELTKIATQKMNEERYVKIRQKLINGGMNLEEVDKKMYRIQRSVWKKLYVTICRRCRKRGHILKDCPETASDSKTKCYKCGKTDHTSKMCSIKEEVYTFADCFICHQTGHLTRTCPNNPKGIYPRGGCCHYCGEVTHLARDCPNKYGIKKAEENGDDDAKHKMKPVAVMLDVNQSADADVTECQQAPKKASKPKGKRVVKF